MYVPLRSLAGLAGLPTDRTALSAWFKRKYLKTQIRKSNGGGTEVIDLLTVPEAVQTAYQLRLAESAGIIMGERDDQAWLDLEAKPVGVQGMARARASTLLFVTKHRAAGLKWAQIEPRLAEEGFDRCPGERTVKRWFDQVEGINPVNWAPALAPAYSTTGRPLAKCDDAAWQDFEVRIAASGCNGTGANFKKQHARTKTEADRNGWAFPNYRTVMRHWDAMAVERQRTLEKGATEAARSLTHFLPRSTDAMRAMEQVEVDFREFKILCVWEDGTVGCPRVGLAVDRASSKIVGRTIAKTENAEAVVALTRDTVESHGIPDRLVQDNGAAFSGLRMMGGKTPLVRRKDKGERNPEWAVPGVYEFLGIEVSSHGPEMAWAKLPESINSILRHLDNDPVFYRAQRVGPTDAPNPNPVLATGPDGREGVLPLRRTAGGALGVVADALFALGGVPDDDTAVERAAAPALQPSGRIAQMMQEMGLMIRPGDRSGEAGGSLGRAAMQGLLPDLAPTAAARPLAPWQSPLMAGPGMSLAARSWRQETGRGRGGQVPYAAALQSLTGAGAAGASRRIEIINRAEGFQAKEGETRMEGGDQIIQVFMDRVRETLAGDFARGTGPVPGAVAGAFGLTRQGR